MPPILIPPIYSIACCWGCMFPIRYLFFLFFFSLCLFFYFSSSHVKKGVVRKPGQAEVPFPHPVPRERGFDPIFQGTRPMLQKTVVFVVLQTHGGPGTRTNTFLSVVFDWLGGRPRASGLGLLWPRQNTKTWLETTLGLGGWVR